MQSFTSLVNVIVEFLRFSFLELVDYFPKPERQGDLSWNFSWKGFERKFGTTFKTKEGLGGIRQSAQFFGLFASDNSGQKSYHIL